MRKKTTATNELTEGQIFGIIWGGFGLFSIAKSAIGTISSTALGSVSIFNCIIFIVPGILLLYFCRNKLENKNHSSKAHEGNRKKWFIFFVLICLTWIAYKYYTEPESRNIANSTLFREDSTSATKQTVLPDNQITQEELITLVRINRQLDYVLTDHLMRGSKVFAYDFNFSVDGYNETYRGMVRRLYKQFWVKHDSKSAYRTLYQAFGRTTADNLKWVYEHWERYKDIYPKDF